MRIRTQNIRNDDAFLLHGNAEELSSALPEGMIFLLLALLILLFGLSMLYSTSFAQTGTGMFMKQVMWSGIGMMMFTGVVLIGHDRIASFSPFLLAGLILLLLLPVTVMRHKVNGAFRWIVLGPIRVQPSEFAKVVMVIFWANFLSRHSRQIELEPLKKICPVMFGSLAVVALLIMAGRDLGTTALLCIVFFSMLFVGGVPLRYVLPLPALAVGGLLGINIPLVRGLLMKIGILTQYRMARLTSYLDPEQFADKEGYQLWHSQLALGSGSWTGIGFTESRFKLQYLPEAHTDFILAIVGEELGFVFIGLVIFVYLIFALVGYLICRKARTRQGMLIAFGMTTFMAVQAFINIGVICGALPTKGMPAPLISYGGSSLVTCLTAAGLIFSVALDSAYPDYPDAIRQKVRFLLHGKGAGNESA